MSWAGLKENKSSRGLSMKQPRHKKIAIITRFLCGAFLQKLKVLLSMVDRVPGVPGEFSRWSLGTQDTKARWGKGRGDRGELI